MINPGHNVFNKLPTTIRGYFEVAIKLFSLGFIFTLLNYCIMGKTTHLQFIAYSTSILLSASLILSLPILVGYFLSGNHFLKIVSVISNLISVLIVSVFVLSVFAPAQFGLLDGTELNRQFSNEQHIYDALRFSGCVLAAVLLFIFFKNQFRRIGNLMVVFAFVYVAIFAMKAGTVASGSISQNKQIAGKPEKIKQLPDMISHCPSRHGVSDFQIHLQRLSSWDFLGKDKNIIFILLDSFQGSILEAFIKKNDDIIDDFQGFTAYTKAVSPFPSTVFSFPVILSGKFYNDTFDDFCDVWMAAHRDSFILDAEQNGFDVKAVPYSNSNTFHFGNAKQYIFDNNDRITIDTLYGALKDASARILPISASQLILRSFPAMADPFGNIYHKRKSDFFLRSLIDNIRIGESSKALFAIHSYATHAPILWNSRGREKRNIAVNSKNALDEYKYILGQLAGLWDRLKRLGVYDNSLILVLGDHGTFGYFGEIYENIDYDPSTKGMNWRSVAMHTPAIMIKPPYRKSNMEIHWGAVSLADLRNIINKYLVSDDWQKLAKNKKMLDFSQHRKNVVYLTSKNVPLNYRKSQNFIKVEFDGNASKLPAVFVNTFPSPKYELGQAVLVNGESPYLRRGWRGAETTGAWADKRKAYIKFEHHENIPSDLIMKIEAHALVTKKFPRQRVMVYFNDIKIGELVFLYTKHHQNKTVFKLYISSDVFNRQGPNKTIIFESLDLISPTAAGVWRGEFKLSFFLYQFSIYPG